MVQFNQRMDLSDAVIRGLTESCRVMGQRADAKDRVINDMEDRFMRLETKSAAAKVNADWLAIRELCNLAQDTAMHLSKPSFHTHVPGEGVIPVEVELALHRNDLCPLTHQHLEVMWTSPFGSPRCFGNHAAHDYFKEEQRAAVHSLCQHPLYHVFLGIFLFHYREVC